MLLIPPHYNSDAINSFTQTCTDQQPLADREHGRDIATYVVAAEDPRANPHALLLTQSPV